MVILMSEYTDSKNKRHLVEHLTRSQADEAEKEQLLRELLRLFAGPETKTPIPTAPPLRGWR